MIYGHDRTWHRTTDVNVELDKRGRVVAVWFRCMPLPFTQQVADDDRVTEMDRMYAERPPLPLVAVELEENPELDTSHA